MENSNSAGEAFCYIYMPNNFAQIVNTEFKLDSQIVLVGRVKIINRSNCYQNPEGLLTSVSTSSTPSVCTIKVVLIGIQSKSLKENHNLEESSRNRNNELFYIGEIYSKSDKSKFRKDKDVSASIIWLTIEFNLETLSVTFSKILFNGKVLPVHNILILTFDPIILSRYVSLNLKELTSMRSTNIIPQILTSSFFEINFPNEQHAFVKILPQIEESMSISPTKSTNLVPESEKTRKVISKENFKLKIIERSVIFKQIQHKISSVLKVLREDLSWIALANIVLILMLDTFFGTLVSSYLKEFPNLYSLILERVEELLQILLQLIGWLGGSPAGLKLNAALNALMGRFFSYHLHLWRNYIGILEPILSFILSTLINIGFCGLTLQIALAKDLLSIATFHIYCLYIYATRLFNVELNTLKSLGRLFFGRKWNPLRNRIDSIHLSNSEMFLSSMGFTISVFLAPTAILYYIVFLSLRLPCLIVESILTCVIQIVNSMELVTSFLIVSNSSWVADDIYIKLKPVLGFPRELEIQQYEIRTQTTQNLFRIPNFRKPIVEILCKIFQSKVITL